MRTMAQAPCVLIVCFPVCSQLLLVSSCLFHIMLLHQSHGRVSGPDPDVALVTAPFLLLMLLLLSLVRHLLVPMFMLR